MLSEERDLRAPARAPARKQGSVTVAYDCRSSMADNCDWGPVSGESVVHVDGDTIKLERTKFHKAKHPKTCGE